MDIEETLRGIQPLPGHLIPIKTVQEARPPEEFGTSHPIDTHEPI
jgi:tRNA-specific adenosine deaminase 3